MAACLITVSGTEGLLRLDYKIGVDSYSVETSIGTFYIEDTATDVTYTTLTGDVIASSGCLTITELPAACYTISWQNISLDNLVIDAVLLGTTIYPIEDFGLLTADLALANAVNDLNNNDIKVIAYKPFTITYSDPTYGNSSETTGWSYIFKILGSDLPSIRLRETISSSFMYIDGIEHVCSSTTGYTLLDPCYSTSPSTP